MGHITHMGTISYQQTRLSKAMIMHTRSIWLKEKVQIFIILFEKEYNKGSLFVAIEFSSSKDVLN